MRQWLNRYRGSTAGAIAGLSIATAIGQGFAVLGAAVLAHMLLPDAFAVYGAYVATLTWFGWGVCGDQKSHRPARDRRRSIHCDLDRDLLIDPVALVTLVFVIALGTTFARTMGVPELAKLLPSYPSDCSPWESPMHLTIVRSASICTDRS